MFLFGWLIEVRSNWEGVLPRLHQTIAIHWHFVDFEHRNPSVVLAALIASLEHCLQTYLTFSPGVLLPGAIIWCSYSVLLPGVLLPGFFSPDVLI